MMRWLVSSEPVMMRWLVSSDDDDHVSFFHRYYDISLSSHFLPHCPLIFWLIIVFVFVGISPSVASLYCRHKSVSCVSVLFMYMHRHKSVGCIRICHDISWSYFGLVFFMSQILVEVRASLRFILVDFQIHL